MNFIFFASVLDDEPVAGFWRMGPVLRERLILFGAILLVTSLIAGWVLLFRKGRHGSGRREESSHRHHRRSLTKKAAQGVAEIKQLVQEHKRRRRRREHRPRNPTLAETGGLPPLRGTEPPPPSQNQPQ